MRVTRLCSATLLLIVVVGIVHQLWAATTAPIGTSTGGVIVARMWQGRVSTSKADAYQAYLFEAGLNKIQTVPGNLGLQMMRRVDGDVTYFKVISYWPSREAIRAFAGEDIEKPRHLPRDPEFLLELPERVTHYDVTYSDVARVGIGGK